MLYLDLAQLSRPGPGAGGGAIGRRYRRMDEAGTPYCFTIDGETAGTGTVTVRERNTQSQERIALDKVEAFLAEKIG